MKYIHNLSVELWFGSLDRLNMELFASSNNIYFKHIFFTILITGIINENSLDWVILIVTNLRYLFHYLLYFLSCHFFRFLVLTFIIVKIFLSFKIN